MENPDPATIPDSSPARRIAGWKRIPAAVFVAVLAVVALFLWQWYDGRSRMDALREELAQRLRDTDGESRDARLLAKQAQESLREAQARLSQLELKLAESQNQQLALESLYQELSRNRDEWVLAEVEQILAIAAQQLHLAGNIQAALAALQTADARLARPGRPQFISVRKALERDIDRLKTAPNINVPALAATLDQVIAGADSLPLAQDARPQAGAESAAPPVQQGFWTRLMAELLGELKQLIRVEKLERADPALLTPSQTFFLRENFKLRLLSARLALVARDEVTYRGDLKAAASWLDRYFDSRSPAAAAAAASLKQLASSGISLALPTLGESLAAVRNYKASLDRAAR
jgi:uroporphyrin-3 C-methyltransferase